MIDLQGSKLDAQKNTATDSSDTMRTARSGCLTRTFAASSCTASEMEMRRAMSISRAPKARSPDSVDDILCGFGAMPKQPRVLSSLVAEESTLGKAVITMDSIRTEPISSASESCASLAASKSSRPMPKLTEKARSEPKLPRALSAIAPDGDDDYDSVYLAVVDGTLREAHHMPARLAWQVPSNGGSALVMRRLLVAPRGVKRGVDVGGPMRQQRLHSTRSHYTQLQCGGTVFGCTLGNLVHHARRITDGRPLCRVMTTLRRALAPAGRALQSATGCDAAHLVRGMACHRVLAAQGKRLQELKRCPPIDSRTGHVGIVLGISTAVLVAFECMAAHEVDCDGLGVQFSACLRDAQTALVAWRLPDVYMDGMREARDSEVRALERGRMGVSRAQERCAALDPPAAMRLQLDCYRRAVWPAGEELSDRSHLGVLRRIKSGELVDLEHDALASGSAAPGVATLAALPLAPWVASSPRAWDTSSLLDSSDSSSFSSWGSFASSADSDAGTGFNPCLDHLALAMNASVLSAAARAASAPRPTISSRPVLELAT